MSVNDHSDGPETDRMGAISSWLDVGELDSLGPLLRFLGHEVSDVIRIGAVPSAATRASNPESGKTASTPLLSTLMIVLGVLF